MDIVEEAFRLLYPDKEFNYETKVKYSGHFSDYGANIKIKGNIICLGMSKKWKGVSREIQIGLAQELLLKILGKRNKKELKNISTTYLDLYNSFIKNIHIAIPKTHIEPMLSESFDRVNEKYFYGLVEKPNLVWGGDSLRCLGSYDYKKDTIKISRIFEKLGKKDPDLLDIVMYHEILHKSHKFKNKLGHNRYHDSQFRKKERQFENYREVEKRLKKALRIQGIRRVLWFV